jgi:hypothetical protein
MLTDKQTKLLYLLNQIDELKAEKKTALKDFNATIEELNDQLKSIRTELEAENADKG